MNSTAIVLVTATLFGWGLVSRRMARADLTAPIVFIVVGALLAWTGLVDGPEESAALTPLVEVTLVWVLFSDAARLPLGELRHDVGRFVRLLGIGLPLTVLLGWALSAWFWPGLGLWLALFVGAALAPTDAALGVPVVTNPVVPSRIRQLITVESGLNDGIATPVVMVAIAGAAAAAGLEGHEGAGSRRRPARPWRADRLRRSGPWAAGCSAWPAAATLAAEDFAGIAVLALALLSYAAALVLDGNGFVAAFCGGLAFGACAGRRAPQELVFLEQMGELVSVLVWLAFGAVAVPIMLERVDARMVLYAVLSLTVVRMVPVALALVRSGLQSPHGALRGLVRPQGAGLAGVRPAGPGGAGAGRRRGSRDRHRHGPAQRRWPTG